MGSTNIDKDEKIGLAKKEMLDYYDVTKYELEIDCQEVLEELRNKNKDYKAVLKQFEDLLELNESIYRKAMQNFNDFIKENNDLDHLCANDMMQKFINSTLYFKSKDNRMGYPEDEANKKVVGVFVHANRFLSSNKLNFIKIKLLKKELTKDIQLSLDEVNVKNKFFAS